MSMKTDNNVSRIFPLQYPFGMIFKRPSYTSITESPYFWWWYALTLNTEYIKCCAHKGKGDLRALYKDFGDVRHIASHRVALDNVELLRAFITWWRAPMSSTDSTTRAVYLFAEPAHPFTARTITDIDDAEAVLNDPRQALISVPLDVTKGGLIKMLMKQATALNTRKRGSAIRKLSSSQALYIPTSTPNVERLGQMFHCYDIYIKSKRTGKRLTNTNISEEAGVYSTMSEDAFPMENKNAIKLRSGGDYMNDKNFLLTQQRADALKVSKYLGAAKKIIANVAEGKFP